jgi:hypothetical protein
LRHDGAYQGKHGQSEDEEVGECEPHIGPPPVAIFLGILAVEKCGVFKVFRRRAGVCRVFLHGGGEGNDRLEEAMAIRIRRIEWCKSTSDMRRCGEDAINAGEQKAERRRRKQQMAG